MTAYAINYIKMKAKSIPMFSESKQFKYILTDGNSMQIKYTYIYRNPEPGHYCGLVI